MNTKEHLSPLGKYKLIIQTFESKYTIGSVYTVQTNEFCGSIERNSAYFPFLFFVKNNREFLVAGENDLSQSIINCETGHTYKSKQGTFHWTEMWQVDEKTLCVCGYVVNTVYQFKFFDFSDLFKGWPELYVDMDEDKIQEVKNMEYLLTHLDLKSENNYSDPIVQNGEIEFVVKESRVRWVAKTKLDYQISELDMELGEYLEQNKEPNGYEIFDYKDKIYQIDKCRIKFKRIDNKMVLIDLWVKQ